MRFLVHYRCEYSGSLCHQAKVEAFLNTVEEIINSDQPKSAYEKMAEQLLKLYDLRPSKKHLVGFDMGQFDEVCSERLQFIKQCGCDDFQES